MAEEATKPQEASKGKRRGRGPSARRVTRLRRYQEVDHCMIEEHFLLREPSRENAASKEDKKAGEGCYISATIQNRRFYGVLVEESALKAASMLHFVDAASGLDLNRRMQALGQNHNNNHTAQSSSSSSDNGNSSEHTLNGNGKRPALSEPPVAASTLSLIKSSSPKKSKSLKAAKLPPKAHQPVQKFRFVDTTENGVANGYRELLATYLDVKAAAEDDPKRMKLIEAACRAGGNYVGSYFYQYEAPASTLDVAEMSKSDGNAVMRTSMGFEEFLSYTAKKLPNWHPLAHNMEVGAQQKILDMLKLRKDNNGNVIRDEKVQHTPAITSSLQRSMIPMEPRTFFRVCVVGAGIAGLSCCLEIFRECEKEGIDVEVVLLEGRNRAGGRLWTDRDTFKFKDGKSFPVDLGASWIHGIESNPLAALAREAKVDFVRTSEEVRMFQAGMQEVDKKKDERAGKVFDTLLDLAADDIWGQDDTKDPDDLGQAAVRWYASALSGKKTQRKNFARPPAVDSAMHRRSSDISVDRAIGNAVAKHKFSEFAKLSKEEHHMLQWNIKNVEYALGANISDLSMRFWDIDERHAFDGDHVILRQGYSRVVEHLIQALKEKGGRFKFLKSCPVSKIHYSRKTTTQTHIGNSSRTRQCLDLSDTCCVSAADGKRSILCDFVVSAVPLGVLKAAVSSSDSSGEKIQFDPPLPFSKRDAIESVGFGLLNKVYLQFSEAFWRRADILGDALSLFGNASGMNPHHYMFLDVGKSLHDEGEAPPILMSLISGKEAVKCETMSDKAVVEEVVATLRHLFSKIVIPEPIAFKVTRWGDDRFSRGSYTFLPPGTTDQDFQLLQSPINANGDSILLEGSETMRLFFAGEHTTALHPSMAHGAMLSGVRAAKEVVAAATLDFPYEDHIDRLIPLAMFRHAYPNSELRCSLCHQTGTRIRESSLLAFKKGSRQVLVHNNCAENCPEVEVADGRWQNVLKAVNRARTKKCYLCRVHGAAIGCLHEGCNRSFHFSCAEDTGWRFDVDGKEFVCDDHREFDGDESCNKISMKFYLSKYKESELRCRLCKVSGDCRSAGELLAFQLRKDLALVHDRCIRYTTVVDTSQITASRFDHDYRNVFEAVSRSVICTKCDKAGATIQCSSSTCSSCFHFTCAENTGWNFEKRGSHFRCNLHRTSTNETKTVANEEPAPADAKPNGIFQHALFSLQSADLPVDVPGNLDIGGFSKPASAELRPPEADDASFASSAVDSEPDFEEMIGGEQDNGIVVPSVKSIPLEPQLTHRFDKTGGYEALLVGLHRRSVLDRWGVEFFVTPIAKSEEFLLSVATGKFDIIDELRNGDIVTSINGIPIGSFELQTPRKVLNRLKQEVDAMLGITRLHDSDVPPTALLKTAK